MLPAVKHVSVPIFTRIVPVAVPEPVVSVSLVSSESETVIHAVMVPASVCVETVVPPSPVLSSFALHGTG